ncbi:MAG: amidohydrolase family protein [Pseudomonadales bacterium]|nr:amidohydrolase family protein [Pseudomonadales bacterium]
MTRAGSRRLIINAELLLPGGGTRRANVLIAGERIESIDAVASLENVTIIDARGGLLIPGLHDHHTHLVSYAASLASVRCGPPEVMNESDLASTINAPGRGWLRGTGFHESVFLHLDRNWLDRHGPDRPIRIQHRSGRLWIVNTPALDAIARAAASLAPHEQSRLSSPDGRLFDVDELLGNVMRSIEPPIETASRNLAALGVTSINDMTPANDHETYEWFARLQASGELVQRVRMSGRPGLSSARGGSRLSVGETKVHLHDSSLPDIDDFAATIRRSHEAQRPVAVHCVTEVSLVFTLSAFHAAGVVPGDRIEHASVVPPALIAQLVDPGLVVVTQPNFIAERGDDYLSAIPMAEHDWLYRVRSLIEAGVPVAFGTDAPFGHHDPWRAMSAAMTRRTAAGSHLGRKECVDAETALAGFLGELGSPSIPRVIEPGALADCCLLDVSWRTLRSNLDASHVRMTIASGDIVYSRD